MVKQKLLSVSVSLGKFEEHIANIVDLAKKNLSSYVCVCNVHMTIEAYKNSSFANILDKADIVTPDGLPLSKSLKWLYGINQERVSGPDLMPALLEVAQKESLNVFFYGSTEEVLRKLLLHCNEIYPNLNLVGSYSPPFRELSASEENEVIHMINSKHTNILFVALGCPKQEKWMSKMKGSLNCVMLGVGGAFPMLAGLEKRAPVWMQKLMLEWFFRLLQDPIRLFKRYLFTNTMFIILIFKEKLKNIHL